MARHHVEATPRSRSLLVIEDGDEYTDFAQVFLSDVFRIATARSGEEALACARSDPPDALLIDLRFERAPIGTLVGDVDDAAERLFGGDRDRAHRWLKDQQGTLILAQLREHGCEASAVFIHDFLARRLRNLRKLYGRVEAVPAFDAERVRNALGVGP